MEITDVRVFPVDEEKLKAFVSIIIDDCITCPWHGFQYDVMTGELLVDPSAKLDTFPVEIKAGKIYVQIPASEAPAQI